MEERKKEVENKVEQMFLNNDLILVNDTVIIQNGLILGNPFFLKLNSNSTLEWVVKHKNTVYNLIGFWLKQFNFSNSGIDIDDCFDSIVQFFMENPEKEFKENFFGENSTYTIKEYVKYCVKLCVMNYIKNYLSERKNIVSKATSSETLAYLEDNIYFAGYDSNEMENISYNLEPSEKDTHEKFLEFDVLFDSLSNYNKYFSEKGYKEFDVLGYFTYMYFDVEKDKEKQKENSNSELISNQVLYTASKINESKELVSMVTADLKSDYLKRNREAKKILNTIRTLVSALSETGWKPEILRNENMKDSISKRKEVEQYWIVE